MRLLLALCHGCRLRRGTACPSSSASLAPSTSSRSGRSASSFTSLASNRSPCHRQGGYGPASSSMPSSLCALPLSVLARSLSFITHSLSDYLYIIAMLKTSPLLVRSLTCSSRIAARQQERTGHRRTQLDDPSGRHRRSSRRYSSRQSSPLPNRRPPRHRRFSRRRVQRDAIIRYSLFHNRRGRKA